MGIVDTPGFGDTDNDDDMLIDEMMSVLKDTLKGANAILLLVNGQQQRFNPSIQQMLREMQALFGDDFWQYTMVGVSFWPYDSKSVHQREYRGITEEKFMKDWNQLLSSKFHLNLTLPGVFIDSFAKQPWHLDDQDQQVAFNRETGKLWSFSTSNDLFMFRTVQDVLEENRKLKDDIACLNDQVAKDIDDLKDGLTKTQDGLTKTQDGLTKTQHKVNENVQQINKTKTSIDDLHIDNDNIKMNMNILGKKIDSSDARLTEQIKSSNDKDKQQDSSLQQTKSDLSKTNSDVKTYEVQTTASISQLNGEISSKEKNLPVGTILSLWKLPAGWSDNWISCDGQIINKGPFVNQKAPDLNRGQRFLRGGSSTTAGTYQVEDTNMNKLGGSYLDRFFVEGASGDEGDGIGCGEGNAVRWTNEDSFSHYKCNAECKVTRSVQF